MTKACLVQNLLYFPNTWNISLKEIVKQSFGREEFVLSQSEQNQPDNDDVTAKNIVIHILTTKQPKICYETGHCLFKNLNEIIQQILNI